MLAWRAVASAILVAFLGWSPSVGAESRLRARDSHLLGTSTYDQFDTAQPRLAFSDHRLYVTDKNLANGRCGALSIYDLDHDLAPLGQTVWPTAKWPSMKFLPKHGFINERFLNVATDANRLLVVGETASLASDTMGSIDRKGLLAAFSPDGVVVGSHGGAVWAASANAFPYQGAERFDAVLAAREGSATVMYAAGSAKASDYNETAILAKFTDQGELLWLMPLSDTRKQFESRAMALAMVNGMLYVGGFTSGDGPSYPSRETLIKMTESGDPAQLRQALMLQGSLPLLPTLWKIDPTSGKSVWVRAVSQIQNGGDPHWVSQWKRTVALTTDGHALYLASTRMSRYENVTELSVLKFDEAGTILWSLGRDEWRVEEVADLAATPDRLLLVGFSRATMISEYYREPRCSGSLILEIDPSEGTVLAEQFLEPSGMSLVMAEWQKKKPDTTEHLHADEFMPVDLEVRGSDVYIAGSQNRYAISKGPGHFQNQLVGGMVRLLRYTLTPETTVAVDIRPGDPLNTIDPASQEPLPVAILSAPRLFNAPRELDVASLAVGRPGEEHPLDATRCRTTDVNGDGHEDLLCLVPASSMGFRSGDTVASLKGRATRGTPLVGQDAVRVVQLRSEEPQAAPSAPAAPATLEPTLAPAPGTNTIAPVLLAPPITLPTLPAPTTPLASAEPTLTVLTTEQAVPASASAASSSPVTLSPSAPTTAATPALDDVTRAHHEALMAARQSGSTKRVLTSVPAATPLASTPSTTPASTATTLPLSTSTSPALTTPATTLRSSDDADSDHSASRLSPASGTAMSSRSAPLVSLERAP